MTPAQRLETTDKKKNSVTFDGCNATLCGIVSIPIPGSNIVLPVEYKTNPHMAAWQITYQYHTHVICTKVKHQTGGIRTSLNMALFCWVGGYHPALQAGLYLQYLMTQKSSCCVSVPFISTRDVHAEQSNTSQRAATADSSDKIHWLDWWYWSVTEDCAREYHFPPIRGQLGKHPAKEESNQESPCT